MRTRVRVCVCGSACGRNVCVFGRGVRVMRESVGVVGVRTRGARQVGCVAGSAPHPYPRLVRSPSLVPVTTACCVCAWYAQVRAFYRAACARSKRAPAAQDVRECRVWCAMLSCVGQEHND